MMDPIDRRAAINAAGRADYRGLAVEDVKKVTDEVIKELKRLPSAQPEIIHCRDCKHYYYADNRVPQEQMCVCDLDGDRWTPDSFCSFGERKSE